MVDRLCRSLHEEFDVANLKVEAPALVIMGGKDYSLKFRGIEEYIKSGRAKIYVPEFETAVLPEGSHFMQEQLPHQVNQLILNFLCNHSWFIGAAETKTIPVVLINSLFLGVVCNVTVNFTPLK